MSEANDRIRDAFAPIDETIYQAYTEKWPDSRLKAALSPKWASVEAAKKAFLADPEKQRRIAALRAHASR